jgi:hypothetical protein
MCDRLDEGGRAEPSIAGHCGMAAIVRRERIRQKIIVDGLIPNFRRL